MSANVHSARLSGGTTKSPPGWSRSSSSFLPDDDDEYKKRHRPVAWTQRASVAVRLMAVYVVAWALLILSWRCLYEQMVLSEAGATTLAFLVASVSAVLACACHVVLAWGLVLRRGFHFRRWLASRRRSYPPHAAAPWHDGSAAKCAEDCRIGRRELIVVGIPLLDVTLTYVIVGLSVPAKFVQTKEIVLATARSVSDAVFMLSATALVLFHVTNVIFHTHHRKFALTTAVAARRRSLVRRAHLPGLLTVACVVVFLCLPRVLFVVIQVATRDVAGTMMETVLGDAPGRETDFCVTEGGSRTTRKLRRSWILPEVLPRRFFSFYMGTEACEHRSASGQPLKLGFIDDDRQMLIVPDVCPGRHRGDKADKQRPRVYLARPQYSDLRPAGRERGLHAAGVALQHELEATYGERGALRDKVTVHRAADGTIAEVELRTDDLAATVRHSGSAREAAIMATWPAGTRVVEVALGWSAAYTVRCDGVDVEDYFLHPITLPRALANTTAAAPPRNMLVLMLDAVSRPEVLRSLPRTTAWLRQFQKLGSHVVVEGRGHTTFGFSTAGNFAPSIAGTSALIEHSTMETFPGVNFANRTLFSAAKRTYGENLRTSLAMGYCHNILHAVFGASDTSTGNGGPTGYEEGGVDRYLYGPMCHEQYSARESNIRGPYSILRRCMGSNHAHEHLLNYTTALLRQHRRAQESFFDLVYFIEGHEGAHSVLSQVDEALVEFLSALQGEIGFFADSRNVLVIYADHGSHMGPYYLASEAGRMERTMPVLLMAMHPTVVEDIDKDKQRSPGTALRNLMRRTMGQTTPMDLFLTMAELLGVGQNEAAVAQCFADSPSPPRSLFDPLTDTGRRTPRTSTDDVLSSDAAARLERFPLAAHWCDFDTTHA